LKAIEAIDQTANILLSKRWRHIFGRFPLVAAQCAIMFVADHADHGELSRLSRKRRHHSSIAFLQGLSQPRQQQLV
jgi:hypothetical protein